jgi:2-keto-myo-inositol isomerase
MSSTDSNGLTRRQWLGAAGTLGAVASGALAESSLAIAQAGSKSDRDAGRNRPVSFGYCLNTSTIRGQKLDLPTQIDVIADAGYAAVEIWVRDIEEFAKQGGSVKDLAKRIADRGLSVPSTISFFPWLVDDPAKRKLGLEQARREMDLARQVGGLRIAAPPVGAPEHGRLDLFQAAERYRALIDLGASIGVIPQVELWGFSKSLSRVGEVACVVMESGHRDACLLLDVYHIYKGGSDFQSLRVLSGESMHVIHFNDYPANPPRAQINDAARVFPGDGVAPLDLILRNLRDTDFHGFLSLEVFNRDYWKQDAHLVARTGLEKMKAVVHRALT